MSSGDRIKSNTLDSYSGVQKLVSQLASPAVCLPLDNKNRAPLPDPIMIIIAQASYDWESELPKILGKAGRQPILLIRESAEDLPIVNDGRLVDVVELPITEEALQQKLSFLGKVHSIAEEREIHLDAHSKQLDYMYRYDGLTGLLNRREFTLDLQEEMENVSEDEDLTLFIFNIDLFNDLNKKYGLDFGDFVLNEMGARLTLTMERPARCYRYSTEDFAALLPGYSIEDAKPLAKKLLRICSEKPFDDAGHSISLTLSLGMASYRKHRPKDHEKFIFMAESALFNAKASGRDRAEIYMETNIDAYSDQANPLIFLKDKLTRILDKTRTSAITSLQHLAKSVAGAEHKKHAEQVVSYTELLSEQMRLPKQLRQTFHNSITLYTSFRFLLHNDLLTKPGSLTREEWQIIEDLPFKIRELTDMFDYFSEERELLVCQGENYDGSGYPDGLKGNEIPIGSRILKIVDSLAAMNGERPYRRRLTPEEIIRELYHGAGKQFDPFLVLQTFQIIGRHKLLEVDPDYLAKAQHDLNERVKELLL